MSKRNDSPIVVTTSTDLESSRLEDFKAQLDYEFFENFTSEHTKKSYRSDINQFVDFLLLSFPNIENPAQIQRFHMVAYRNHLQEKKLAPKTVNRKLSAISSYLDFLTEKGLMPHNPSKSIKRPRQEVLSPTNDLSDEQVIKMLQSIDPNSPSAYLHRAVLYTLFSTGIRKAELIQLKRKDYRIINEHHTIEVTAKGAKQLIKVLHPQCVAVLEQYLNWMAADGRELSSEDWLFQPTRNPRVKQQCPRELNKALRPSSIDYMISKACQRANIEQRISAHSARASYIGSALENGIDLWKISQDVGHASVKTTEIYNKRRQRIQDSPAYGLGFFDDSEEFKKKKA